MGIYRDLGRNPGVFRIIASQVVARFPFGMLSIIMLLHIEQRFGDYTSAGVVLALGSVGQAISGPLSSRLMGRFGMRQVLTLTSILSATLLAIIAFVPLPLVVVIIIAFFMGLSTPPVTPAVRTLFPKLVPGTQLPALFSLDAALQEVIWIFGPVVAVFVSSQFGTAVGLGVAAGFMVAGGVWFVASPILGRVKIPKAKRRFGAVLRLPTVVIGTAVSFFLVASFAAVEAGIVAAFANEGSGDGHGSMDSGVVLAIFATGSLLGGLFVGHRPNRPWSLVVRLSIVLVGTAACFVSLNMWWLSAMLFIAGLGTAPTFAAVSAIVSSTVKFSETAEAFGWVGTGTLVGVALGSAAAGVSIDHYGAMGAIVIAALLLVGGIAFSVANISKIPDLKDRVIEPPPDTETITLPLP